MAAQRKLAALAIAAAVVSFVSIGGTPAEAGAHVKARGHSHHSQYAPRDYAPRVRDCTPINGPHGYYSNPFCDGGFLTLEEQEYRTAKRLDIDLYGYRYRDGRRKLFRAR